MSAVETENVTFVINFKAQLDDGIINGQDMIAYFQSLMKVRNSKVIASRELQFEDKNGIVEVTSKKGNVEKRNMKQYVRRYLRNKALRPFIKLSGDGKCGMTLEYINTVTDDVE
ncbi:hypothetical protein NUSPORA_02237 [Nucleospora cyclopteri]